MSRVRIRCHLFSTILTSIACLVLFAGPVAAFDGRATKSARQIAQEAFPSVVLLVMEDSTGQPTSLGSGFVLRNGFVVTNQHVIKDAARGYCKLIGKSAKYDIAGTVAIDPIHDLAILAVSGLSAPALSIDGSDQLAIGDPLYAIGNPQGLEGTFSEGIVSGIRDISGEKLLQITAPISPGSSGGPILSAGGKVVGIAVATFTGGQNLNLAIPSAYLTKLIPSISTQPLPLSRPGQQHPHEAHSILKDLHEAGVQAVAADHFEWTYDSLGFGDYSFSLRNQGRDSIKFVDVLIIFQDYYKQPIDVARITFGARGKSIYDVIPPGLARRVTGKADSSDHKIAAYKEFRILDFEIVPE